MHNRQALKHWKPASAAQAVGREREHKALKPLCQIPSIGGAMGGSTVVYELRIYLVVSGRIENLVARFRDHTMKLFADHGIKSIAYWTALDEPVKSSTFFYILEHPSREAAAANWKAFQDDPEWKRVKAKSEENGKLVEKMNSTFLTLTDVSPRLA
jgi:hypothetical protein